MEEEPQTQPLKLCKILVTGADHVEGRCLRAERMGHKVSGKRVQIEPHVVYRVVNGGVKGAVWFHNGCDELEGKTDPDECYGVYRNFEILEARELCPELLADWKAFGAQVEAVKLERTRLEREKWSKANEIGLRKLELSALVHKLEEEMKAVHATPIPDLPKPLFMQKYIY